MNLDFGVMTIALIAHQLGVQGSRLLLHRRDYQSIRPIGRQRKAIRPPGMTRRQDTIGNPIRLRSSINRDLEPSLPLLRLATLCRTANPSALTHITGKRTHPSFAYWTSKTSLNDVHVFFVSSGRPVYQISAFPAKRILQ